MPEPIFKNKFVSATKFWINSLKYFKLKNQIHFFSSYGIFAFAPSVEELFKEKFQVNASAISINNCKSTGSFDSTISFHGFSTAQEARPKMFANHFVTSQKYFDGLLSRQLHIQS